MRPHILRFRPPARAAAIFNPVRVRAYALANSSISVATRRTSMVGCRFKLNSGWVHVTDRRFVANVICSKLILVAKVWLVRQF